MIVRKAANLIHQLKKPILGVVENMSYFVAPDTGMRYDVFGPSYADSGRRTRRRADARAPADRSVFGGKSRRRPRRGNRRSDRRRAWPPRSNAPSRRCPKSKKRSRSFEPANRFARFALGAAAGITIGYTAMRVREMLADQASPAPAQARDAKRYGDARRMLMVAGHARAAAAGAMWAFGLADFFERGAGLAAARRCGCRCSSAS